ncbi:hypothetical protein H3H37_00460 [Duganella sp. LX20W]|uniref:Uncharacterized protein n=1 Tax=Rugamonas brunnea TaxID=2758569 RepID=A0A7W2EN76_9BURK|nr:hypothetical protein [Rugamonas brunnea]MBA5635538.1 hypothetical protein [Rugamonas brunnea]
MHGWLLAKVENQRADVFTISPPTTHGNSGTIESDSKKCMDFLMAIKVQKCMWLACFPLLENSLLISSA